MCCTLQVPRSGLLPRVRELLLLTDWPVVDASSERIVWQGEGWEVRFEAGGGYSVTAAHWMDELLTASFLPPIAGTDPLNRHGLHAPQFTRVAQLLVPLADEVDAVVEQKQLCMVCLPPGSEGNYTAVVHRPGTRPDQGLLCPGFRAILERGVEVNL